MSPSLALVDKLKELAAKELNLDPNDPWSCTADLGNQDDAYWGGKEDGQIQLAREILLDLGLN